MARKQITGAELQSPGRVEDVFQELYVEEAAAEQSRRSSFLSRAREEMSKLVKRLSAGSKPAVGASKRK